jgi:hypothetical protein
MLNALSLFDQNIARARELSALYSYLKETITSPFSFEDVLRSQIVYSVSAFDKLIHDVIRIGMLSTYQGTRLPTPRYLREQISIEFHAALTTASLPPKEILFEQEVVRKLSFLSFQDPDKLVDGLSLIWPAKNKWADIAKEMAVDPDAGRTRLKLISARRNAIVHEADMHPLTNIKTAITLAECEDISKFIQSCGQAVVKLVK